MGSEAQRQQAARTEFESGDKAAVVDLHFGIAAEAVSAHGDGLDHGAIAADHGAIGIQPRPAILHDGNVGGRAADIGNNGIVEAGEIARADETCGGTRQDSLDRPELGFVSRNQGAVAAHHHHRRGNAARGQKSFAGADEAVDHRDKAGIEQRRQGAARAAQLGREFMAAGDGQMRDLADAVAHSDFMSRIPHGEIAGDGEGRYRFGQFRQRVAQRRQIERVFIAVNIVAAGKIDHRIGPQRIRQTIALEILRPETDHD